MSLIFGDYGDSGSSSDSGSSGEKLSCELCGWIAAIGGMLAFGSFGVPIKSKVAKSLNIDPLVMQSYKTTMFFLTSWIFVVWRGEKCTFTPWGIVSGLFWVPGGVATIYAIKTAGLATGIGVGSSMIVLMSFFWGIFVFGEHVHNRIQSCFAVGCMLLGLCGMAYFSSSTGTHSRISSGDGAEGDHYSWNPLGSAYYQPMRPDDPDFLRPDEDEPGATNTNHGSSPLGTDYIAMEDETADDNPQNDGTEPIEVENQTELEEDGGGGAPASEENENYPVTVLCCFGLMRVRERTLGILAALIVTGVWGGSILVPMHWAPPLDKGLGYLISFAIGAAIVNLSLWLLRFIYLCCSHSSFMIAYQALPSFYLRKMWLYGGTCGLLWSVGNFCSILAVEYLGEGVGYSATQAAMLVSGLWGIFYFHEIEGTETISKWYMSAMVTVLGILLLSYEHHEK